MRAKNRRSEQNGGFAVCQIMYLVISLPGRCRIHAQRQGELNVLALGEIIQPCQELCDLLLGNLGEHLRKVVDKHMGDVVVAGMQAAEEALEEIVRAHRVRIVAGRRSGAPDTEYRR